MEVRGVTFREKVACAQAAIEQSYQKALRDELEPPETDENGNIIPLPSCLEPDPIRDLNLSEGMEDLGGE